MKNSFVQRQVIRQGFAFGAKLAGILEMPGRDYSKLIGEIESDPLFMQLKYGADGSERAIRYSRFKRAGLSGRFFELNEGIVAHTGDAGAEVEKLLAGKKKILAVIRKIGEERFRRYFICAEEELSVDEIAEHCGVSGGEAVEILRLVNSVDLYNEFSTPQAALPENTPSYNKVAVLVRQKDGIFINFTSVHLARGLYEVNNGIIDRMVAGGRFSPQEKKRLRELLGKIEFVNIRKSLIYIIISKIIEKQRAYLESYGRRERAAFIQKELAKTMGVHPSIISRAVAGRSVETPWGEEKPLKEFFLSAHPQQKQGIVNRIVEILDNEKISMSGGLMKKPLSDSAIAGMLRNKYGVAIAQRTVAKYRNELGIPGAFHRNRR